MGNFIRFIQSFFIFFVFVLSTKVNAHFEFSPITLSLTTTGKTNHAIVQVINRESFPIPIMIRVTERKQLENGEEDRPDTSEIAVFPSQFLLDPKETKSIKVSWQGGETLPAEKAFRIIVEEVPVEFSAKSADRGAVKILINYVGSIYVNSDKTAGELVLESVNGTEDKKSIGLLFANKGTAHAFLKSPSIELTAKAINGLPEKKITLEKKSLESAEGKNVLASSKLMIKIPRPAELKGYETFDWKFSYEK